MRMSGSSSLRRVVDCTVLGQFGPEDEGTMTIGIFANYLADDMA